MRILLAALALVLVASCVSVQSAYDSAARREAILIPRTIVLCGDTQSARVRHHCGTGT